MTETFQVPEVSCDHCKSTIEGALEPVAGVREAVVDVKEKTVSVDFNPDTTNRSAIVAAIESAGYEVAG